jgi:hypothetical protein
VPRARCVRRSERRRFYPAKPHVLRLIQPRTQEQLLTAHDKHSAELLSVDREYQARISGHAAENESLAAKLAAVQVCRAQRLVLLVGLPWRSQHRGVCMHTIGKQAKRLALTAPERVSSAAGGPHGPTGQVCRHGASVARAPQAAGDLCCASVPPLVRSMTPPGLKPVSPCLGLCLAR